MSKYVVIYKSVRDGLDRRCTVEADCEVNAIYRMFRDCPEDTRKRLYDVRCEKMPSLNLQYIDVLTKGV